MLSAMTACFPVITTKRKSTDDPWINDRIRKRIRQRRSVFRREGRSEKWKKLKKKSDKMIKFRREKYLEEHKLIITEPDSSKRFFKNVRAYGCSEKPRIWDIRDIRPDLSDIDLATDLSCISTV